MSEITAATRPAIERVSFSDQESKAVVYGVPAGRWEVPNGPVAVAVVTPRGNVVTLFDWQDWHTPLELGAVYPSPCAIPEALGMPDEIRERVIGIAEAWGISWSGSCASASASARVKVLDA